MCLNVHIDINKNREKPFSDPKNHIPKTLSRSLEVKKPCSKIRSSKNRVRKTLPANPKPEKPCPKIRSQKNRAQKSEARAGKSKNPPTKSHTLFGSGVFVPTVLRIRFLGPGFLDRVFWIRFLRLWFSGYGFSDTVVWGAKCGFYTTKSFLGTT